jgi:hypothetical protein
MPRGKKKIIEMEKPVVVIPEIKHDDDFDMYYIEVGEKTY